MYLECFAVARWDMRNHPHLLSVSTRLCQSLLQPGPLPGGVKPLFAPAHKQVVRVIIECVERDNANSGDNFDGEVTATSNERKVSRDSKKAFKYTRRSKTNAGRNGERTTERSKNKISATRMYAWLLTQAHASK